MLILYTHSFLHGWNISLIDFFKILDIFEKYWPSAFWTMHYSFSWWEEYHWATFSISFLWFPTEITWYAYTQGIFDIELSFLSFLGFLSFTTKDRSFVASISSGTSYQSLHRVHSCSPYSHDVLVWAARALVGVYLVRDWPYRGAS